MVIAFYIRYIGIAAIIMRSPTTNNNNRFPFTDWLDLTWDLTLSLSLSRGPQRSACNACFDRWASLLTVVVMLTPCCKTLPVHTDDTYMLHVQYCTYYINYVLVGTYEVQYSSRLPTYLLTVCIVGIFKKNLCVPRLAALDSIRPQTIRDWSENGRC